MTLGIKHLIITIVVFSIVSFTFFGAVGDIQDNYGVETPEDFTETFNQINETLIYAAGLQEKLINSPAGEQTSTDWLRNSMNNVIKSIMTIPSAFGGAMGLPKALFSIMFNIVQETYNFLHNRFGLPTIYLNAALIVLVVMVVLFIIQILSQLVGLVR